MHKYISDQRFEKYENLIRSGEYEVVIRELIEKYYDQNYSIKKSEFKLEIDNIDSKDTAKKIFEYFI